MYSIFVVYFFLLVAVAYFAYQKKTELERQASRVSRGDIQAHYQGSYSPIFVGMTIFASVFSGYTVVGVPQTTMERGFLVLQFFSGGCAQNFSLCFFTPRLRRLAKARGYLSPYDFVADKYRSVPVTVCVVFAACLPQLIYLAVQLASFGETLNTLSRGLVQKWIGAVFAAVFMLIMELMGGMHAVVLSDIIQGTIMLIGFAALVAILWARYDWLGLGSDTCDGAGTISPDTNDTNCLSGKPYNTTTQDYGCLFLAQPQYEWDLNTYGTQALGLPLPFSLNMIYFWFVVSFFAFPLNPHLLQRISLAETDNDTKKATQLVFWSPFVAFTPGIIAGLVAASYLPLWSQEIGCASAFGMVGAVIQIEGSIFEYLVVSLLSCAALAAIMSSADSLIMGVSNCLCIDIYRNILNPDADAKSTVRVGQGVSIVMVVISLFFAMNINGSSFTAWLGVQNGILFQAAPAVFFGLTSDIPGKAILAGLIVGYLILIPLQYTAIFGDPAAAFFLSVVFHAPTLAGAANFATVKIVACMSGQGDESAESDYSKTLAERFENGSTKLTTETIGECMKGSTPPSPMLLRLSFITAFLTIPFLPISGRVGPMPAWAAVCFLLVIVSTAISFLTISSWKPADGNSEGGLVQEEVEI